LTTQKDALVVPAAAVQRGPTGTFVYVVGGDNTAATRPIELGSIQGDSALITRGLSQGDLVVIDGQNQIRPGSKVSSRPLDKPSSSTSTTVTTATAGSSTLAPTKGSASPTPGTAP
jgi:multidrug efflux system membrane fusion protein